MTTNGSQNDIKKPGTLTHLISGSSAGLISAVALQPLDLLKTRLQQEQKGNSQYRTTITKELKKLTKFKDLWRGVLPSTLRTSIGAGMYFTILSSARSYLHAAKIDQVGVVSSGSSILPKLSHFENLSTGFVARAIAGLATMPITVIKTRYESNFYHYNSISESVQSIYINDAVGGKGTIKNFFRGSAATLSRDCPYAGLYILFYEAFKNDLMPMLVLPFAERISFSSSLINSSSAFMAAVAATTITAPFDAIKTRLQLSSHNSPVKSIKATTLSLLKEDGGAKNLFRGLSLRLGRKGLSAGISWCIYEELIKRNSSTKLS